MRTRDGRSLLPELAAEDQVEIVVQMNGRVKGRVPVEAGLDKDDAGAARSGGSEDSRNFWMGSA